MKEELVLWLVGQSLAITFALIGIYVKIISRIVAIETLLKTMGEKAARALHSPDNHHGIDPLLDKYLDRDYELSYEEWSQLHTKCEEILHAENCSPGEKSLASWLSAICEHKMKCGKRSVI